MLRYIQMGKLWEEHRWGGGTSGVPLGRVDCEMPVRQPSGVVNRLLGI